MHKYLIAGLLSLCCMLSASLYERSSLIPPPQQIEVADGVWKAPRALTVSANKGAKTELQRAIGTLKEFLPSCNVSEVKENAVVSLEVTKENTPDNDEGYRLEITADKIKIAARDVRGIFYGLQTLRNMLLNAEKQELDCVAITDYPGLKMRMINFQVYGLRKANLPQLYRLTDFCASLKYNTILFGITHSFPYSDFRVDPSTDLTKEDLKEYTAFCHRLHIDIVPYVQFLSHVNWLSGFPEWENMLESPSEKNSWGCTWCPNNPKVRKIWQHVLDEQIEVFQPKYFHIGLDEILQGSVATCPRCKKETPNEWLTNELNRYIDHLKKHNVTPIIWHDSFINPNNTSRFYPYNVPMNGWKTLEKLPKNIPIHFWDYGMTLDTPALNYFAEKGFPVLGGAWLPTMGNIPVMAQAIQKCGKQALGSAVLSWYYFSENPENGFYKYGYRTWPGFVIGGHSLWNPQSIDGNLETLKYDPSFEARKRFFPELAHPEKDWKEVPITAAANAEWAQEGVFPVFSATGLKQVQQDYAQLPEHFNVLADASTGNIRSVLVSGEKDGGDGFQSAPATIQTGSLKAKKLAFLVAIVPTDKFDLELNEWHNFNGYRCPSVGFLRFTRADGTTGEIRLMRAMNIFNWNSQFSGWTGSFGAWHRDKKNRLVHFSIIHCDNSKPDVPITSISLESTYYVNRAVALLAVSASGASDIPQAVPLAASTYKGIAVLDWRNGKIEAITEKNIAACIVRNEGFNGSMKQEFVPYPADPTQKSVHLTVPPASGSFGRVILDIPVTVPAYASAFGFSVKSPQPEVFKDAAYYLMDDHYNCLVGGGSVTMEGQFSSCIFKTMSPEGKRITPTDAKWLRVSYRMSNKQPTELWFTFPTWYEIAPVETEWHVYRGQ